MPSWPATIPQSVAWNGYVETTQAAKITSQPDAGPVKSRSRFTAVADLFSMTTPKMTSDQVSTLKSFFKNDCGNGATPFDWKHPRTGELASCLFMSDTIEVRAANRFQYICSFDMAILP